MKFYIMLGAALLISFTITALLGIVIIPYLKKLHFGQTILEIGPRWHKNKEGTPTMGGFLFIAGSLLSIILVFLFDYFTGKEIISKSLVDYGTQNVKLLAGIIMAMMFAFVGFLDDYIIVVKKQNLGLTIKQKTLLQVLIIVAYIVVMYSVGAEYIFVPFIGRVDIGIFYGIFSFIIIYATVNAVNFTDGIDGLCSSVTLVAALIFLIISILLNYTGMSLLAVALAGACGGFLVWNWHPAKVFMGDVGSLFLGGMIVALAFGMDIPILLIPIGIIYLIEGASVVIQMTYFKLTKGKRLFKMTPIHHHFELSKWSEIKIVFVFSLVGLIGGIIAVLLVYFGIVKL